ncbi:SatD family protein [Rhodohalobacter sulfatireducens]|uniref:SatD family protein n=1 Tax=Rhodohalobacter sulfatireducens TaxID=2911366 RepID=A0ABS9K8R2_9BACT|nr:SatD family protein [Rhodohalobacter sulfatireducens]MCG2587252.1 SatD family protein [Rhodohalobacter sulfatireducens]MDR9367082.1 SatD family protein [Balneolaceae bacterium]MDR9408372.1 SatD family protein [Balneolaceae bacterium]
MVGQKDKYYILMGDVVRSSDYESEKLGKTLKELVHSANKDLRKKTLSPYTVTLGDEFQGVTKSLESGIETLFYFEEERLAKELDFKLHYVLHFGKINTEINRETSYGMLGEGLTEARKKLTAKKRDRRRFNFSLEQKEQSEQLNRLFEVLEGITEKWKLDDFALILDMIQSDNDQEVGEKHGKDRSQIYRRRKTLMIHEYNLLKESIRTIIKTKSS